MCKCTPNIRTPFCGKPGCEWPEQLSSNTLLPCPFCGGKAGIHRSHDADGMLWVGVRCQGCGAASTQDWCSPGNDCPIFYEGIRNSWNRRPAHEPSTDQSDIDFLTATLVDQESVLDECEKLLKESLAEDGVECGFDRRLEQYWQKRKALADWRSRELRLAEPPSALRAGDRVEWRGHLGTVTATGVVRVTLDSGHHHTLPVDQLSVTKSAGECGACDKPGEHCANVHGICSRHGGRAHETSAVHKAHDPTCGVFAGMACDCGWLDEHR